MNRPASQKTLLDESATDAPVIAGVGCALPEHRYTQKELLSELSDLWSDAHFNPGRLERFFDAVQVGERRLAVELERYRELDDFGDRNDIFIEVGLELAEQAIRNALDEAELSPTDVDAIFFTTVTGIATPTLDALLINRLGMRSNVVRTPMFGLGCVAGAAGLARMNDFLRAYPEKTAILVSVELCSLTFQRDDFSTTNFIASGLFGDGAACVVGCGALTGAPGPRIVATDRVLYPDTEWVMGWDVKSSGFKVVLSAKLPEIVRTHLRKDTDRFLDELELTRRDMSRWICHPGGPAVLEAMQDALELDEDDLAVTWRSLHEIGNLSSASVLFVLDQTEPADEGEVGMLMAMGPGFCAEMVALQW